MTGQTNVAVQKTSVATARLKATMLHGVPALVKTSDTSTISSPQTHHLILCKTNPLKIMIDIAVKAIVVTLILVAALVIDMITGNAIASQLLATTRNKVTMPNIEADLDQYHNHNHDQGPVLVIFKVWDMTIVIAYIMMTPREGNGHTCLLPSLAQDWNANRPLLDPNLLLFYINP